MIRFHNFLKANDDFQERCFKRYWSFQPNSFWMVMTDAASHAVLRGTLCVGAFVLCRAGVAGAARGVATGSVVEVLRYDGFESRRGVVSRTRELTKKALLVSGEGTLLGRQLFVKLPVGRWPRNPSSIPLAMARRKPALENPFLDDVNESATRTAAKQQFLAETLRGGDPTSPKGRFDCGPGVWLRTVSRGLIGYPGNIDAARPDREHHFARRPHGLATCTGDMFAPAVRDAEPA